MERLASQLIETKHQSGNVQRLLRFPRKFIGVGNLLPLAFLSVPLMLKRLNLLGQLPASGVTLKSSTAGRKPGWQTS